LKSCRFLVLIAVLLGLGWPVAAANATPARGSASRILFMGTRNGNPDIYVTSAKAQEATRITSNPGHDCGPAMRPGPVRELVFASMRIDERYNPGGYFQIYKLDFATGKTRRLTTTPGHNFGPTWSPDGKQIGFSSTRNGSLGAPNWPVSAASLYVMNAEGFHVRQITDAGALSTHNFPAWSPDGKWIAFQSTSKAEPLHPAIYAVRPNGEGMHILQYDAMYPAWSPDSRKIAFTSARAGLPQDQDLYVMNADGSSAHRLTDRSGAEYMPSWSEDGKHLVYVHDPDGWTDIAAVTLLPNGTTRDVYSSGPQPSSIWVGDVATRGGKIVIAHTHQRTTGGDDLFPRFAPAWLH
jgi:TolB protein